MNKEERRLQIIHLIEQSNGQQLLETKELAEQFGVSEMTVRRDLHEAVGRIHADVDLAGVVIHQIGVGVHGAVPADGLQRFAVDEDDLAIRHVGEGSRGVRGRRAVVGQVASQVVGVAGIRDLVVQIVRGDYRRRAVDGHRRAVAGCKLQFRNGSWPLLVK